MSAEPGRPLTSASQPGSDRRCFLSAPIPSSLDDVGAAQACRWTSLPSALVAFAEFAGRTQSMRHILPLHWYVACRLVVEGGFDPDDIIPRPPFRVERRRRAAPLLHFEPGLGGGGEGTILGGLKTKHVDVMVALERIGPVLSVSCKGVTGAFRNLGNRLEEIVGEATNLHMTYPALVMGHLVLLRGNRPIEGGRHDGSGDKIRGHCRGGGDTAIDASGALVPPVQRFHDALRDLGKRHGLADPEGRCEAIALAMVEMDECHRSGLVAGFPEIGSGLELNNLFETLYARYDERYVLRSPEMQRRTMRNVWDPASPGIKLFGLDYRPRASA